MGNKIILIGGFSEIIELCEENGYDNIYIIDKKDAGNGTEYIGNDEFFLNNNNAYLSLPAVITPDDPKVRKKINSKYLNSNISFINLISKHVKISKSALIGIGNVFQYGTYVSSNVQIKDFVKLNVNACVMHDSMISSYTTIAPSATVLGRVKIGEACYIGSMATILPNITICDNVTIGAGAVVTKNISNSGVYAGVPAKKID